VYTVHYVERPQELLEHSMNQNACIKQLDNESLPDEWRINGKGVGDLVGDGEGVGDLVGDGIVGPALSTIDLS
jgi:hypothetical protein